MEVVEDESIATASTSAPKFFGKPRMDHHHRTVDTTMSSSSMLSVETHPPSRSNSNNPFSFQPSSSDTVDSRHDSPKNGQDDSDAMMADTSSSRLVLPCMRSTRAPTTTTTTRVVSGESISNSTVTRNNNHAIGTYGQEERVSLAPRFGKLETTSRDELDQESAEGETDLGNASMFSLSGSISSEFLENQQHSDDHQQEYLHHPNRLGMNSPTSTTSRDFLREVQCPPPFPTHSGERVAGSRTSSFGSLSLHHRFGSVSSATRPPFPPNGTAGLPSHNKASHPTLPREHTPNNASSPSPTNTILGVGSFNCDRDKPVISRCFAWSQDSQDDRRITKRARTTLNGMISSASSPLSNDGVMSPSSALETTRGSAASSIAHLKLGEVPPANAIANPSGNSNVHPNNHSPLHSSPTKVHWEEKVEHSNELMSHANIVDPEILFGINSVIRIATANNEDVAMKDEGQQETNDDRMPPPITTAQPASHYSFDSL